MQKSSRDIKIWEYGSSQGKTPMGKPLIKSSYYYHKMLNRERERVKSYKITSQYGDQASLLLDPFDPVIWVVCS